MVHPASTVEVQLHACETLAIVRAPKQKPLHLNREGVRAMLAKLDEAERQMKPTPAIANPNQPQLPHTV